MRVGFIQLALRLEGRREVVVGLAVFGAGIAVRGSLDCLAEELLGFVVAGLFELHDAQRGVHARVARIAAQRFLPVEVRVDAGIVELLGAQADEVQLFAGLHVRRSAGGVTGFGGGSGFRRIGE